MDNYKISAIQCREAMHQPSPWLHHLNDGCAGLAAHSCGFPPLVGCIINTSISTAVAACREYAGNVQDLVSWSQLPSALCPVTCPGQQLCARAGTAWAMLLRFTIREYSVDSQGWLMFARCPLVERYQRPSPSFLQSFLSTYIQFT